MEIINIKCNLKTMEQFEDVFQLTSCMTNETCGSFLYKLIFFKIKPRLCFFFQNISPNSYHDTDGIERPFYIYFDYTR